MPTECAWKPTTTDELLDSSLRSRNKYMDPYTRLDPRLEVRENGDLVYTGREYVTDVHSLNVTQRDEALRAALGHLAITISSDEEDEEDEKSSSSDDADPDDDDPVLLLQSFETDPSNGGTFPMLSTFVRPGSVYKFDRLSFWYRPLPVRNVPGHLVMVTTYHPNEPVPRTEREKSGAWTNDGLVRNVLFSAMVASSDSYSKFHLCTQGPVPDDTVLGELWVNYVCTVRKQEE